MLNNNIKDYILENIDKKDFFDKKFLIQFREKLIKEDFDLQFSLLNIECGNFYKTSWYDKKIIYLSKKLIEYYIKEYSSHDKKLRHNLVFRNTCVIESLIHEVTHAYQFMWKYTEDSLLCDILNDGDNIFDKGPFSKLNNFFVTKYLYEYYHDLYPFEIHADNCSFLFLMKLYPDIKHILDYPNFDLLQSQKILSLYSIKNNEVICPLEAFYKKMHILDKYKKHDINRLSLIDKLLIGNLDNLVDINIIFNELLNTKGYDYTKYIK